MKKDSALLNIGSVIAFILTGTGSIAIVKLTSSANNLLQALTISIVVIIFTTRIILPRFQTKSSRLVHFIEFAPLTLFVYTLVFSTGGLTSPFIILTHLFAIGMAFLISPKVSISYVILTIIFITTNTYSDPTSKIILEESPFLVFLYLLAYLGIMPFSLYIAKIYHHKEEWVRQLSQSIATSRAQEENLLKNITDPVIILSKDLDISYINSAAKDFTKYKEHEVAGKEISKIFKFKDSLGKNIPSENLPFKTVASSKDETQLNGVQISIKNGNFLRINLKIMPAIDHSGEVLGLILIFKEFSEKDISLGSYYDKLVTKFADYEQGRLYWTARDLLLLTSLEQGLEGVTSFINFSDVVEEEMYIIEQDAKRKKVNMTNPGLEKIPLKPKEPVLMPQKRGLFEPVFILGSQNLLKVAVNYLFKTSLALSKVESAIDIQMKTSSDVVKLEVKVKSEIPQDKAKLLFKKFFTEFVNIKGTETCTGLEIAISESIFAKHAGGLEIQKNDDTLLFTATLIKHEIQETNKSQN